MPSPRRSRLCRSAPPRGWQALALVSPPRRPWLCRSLLRPGDSRRRSISIRLLVRLGYQSSARFDCCVYSLLCRIFVGLGSVGLCSAMAAGARSRVASSFALAIGRPASTVCSSRSCTASSSALALSVSAPPWRPTLDLESPPRSPWLSVVSPHRLCAAVALVPTPRRSRLSRSAAPPPRRQALALVPLLRRS